ncbi:unnamed protein product [Cuscuta campestris]|uniref:Replication factor A C-terminal domain-containing protein n=1 Tax=Cuscuta campestris TaxID=132261 RepID=A0A484M876_9ASTE|nr:unnamed protein product [Cuscuta campestris]
MGCTLWGEYVDQFLGCLTQNAHEPVVMLLSFCHPRRYRGAVTVSTAFHVTKMLFDGNSDEVTEFRARLPPQVDEGSIVLSGGAYGEEGVVKTTTIKALLDTTKPGPYWVVGNIASIHDSGDWCYLGCTDCNKKVIPDGDKFRCSGCDFTMPHGVYRFKVNVRVYDSTGHASFILWDLECTELLGASGFLLRQIMLEKEMDPNFLPAELNRLLGLRGLFHIQVKSEEGSQHWTGPRAFGVRSLVTDSKILSKYEDLSVVEDEGIDEESEGLWASLEDLIQKVHEVVGSSDPSSTQSVNNKSKRIGEFVKNDSVKRELFDESSTNEAKKTKKDPASL